MAKRSFFIAAIIFALYASQCYAIITNASIPIYAVVESEDKAVKAELTISIVPGSGKIWSSIGPLIGTSTQQTERLAVEVAKNYFSDVNKYDYMFDIKSNASVVEGPSAGAAMTLLLVSMLEDKKLPNYVSITGQISEDGSIGSVGGVFLKAKEAHDTGIKLFLIPKGDAYQTYRFPDGIKTVNLVDYAPRNWGLIVVEVANIDEALKYAFMDINKIDINSKISEQKPFVPEKMPLKQKFNVMKELTLNYIVDARSEIKNARDALNDMKYSETEIMSSLLDALTSAQKLLDDANMLYEMNYLYSSANSAFVASTYARFVADVAKNPALFEPDSEILNLWKEALSEKIEKQKQLLKSFYTLERLEWLTAAKQRITWAEVSLNSMDKTSTLVEKLRAYEFANSWYKISQDFYNIAVDARDKFQGTPNLKEIARQYLLDAENCNASLENPDEDITRRIDSAKAAFEQGWYDVTILDSASVKGLCESESIYSSKQLSELVKTLEEKNPAIRKKIESDASTIWAELYLMHSEYFMKSANHYMSEGAKSKAAEDAKTSLSLAHVAEETFDATQKIKKVLAETKQEPITIELPKTEKTTKPVTPANEASGGAFLNNLSVIILPAIIIGSIIGALLIIFALVKLKEKRQVAQLEKKRIRKAISEVERSLKELDKKFLHGKLSSSEYVEKKRICEEKLNSLKNELSRRSKQLLELDRLRGEIKGLSFALEQIRNQYARGEITESDYNKAISEYCARINAIETEIARKEQVSEEEPKKENKQTDNVKSDIAKQKKANKKQKNSKESQEIKKAAK